MSAFVEVVSPYNINRPSKTGGPLRKRPKLVDRTVHLYPPMHGEDYEEVLKAEHEPRSDAMKDLMCRTFPNRWDKYVNNSEPGTLLEYVGQFPLLLM